MGEDKNRMKMAIISGASNAIRYKEKNPGATEEEVIKHVTKEVEKILKEIDKYLWQLGKEYFTKKY